MKELISKLNEWQKECEDIPTAYNVYSRIINYLLEQSQPTSLQGEQEEECYPAEFVKWKDLKTMSDRITRNEVKYMVSDMDAPAEWITLPELYNYWLTNIKNK